MKITRTRNTSMRQMEGIILRRRPLLLLAVLIIPLFLEASSPKMLLSWRNPNYSGEQFKHILVLALNGKAENRLEFEDLLVAAIARPGIEATQSYVFWLALMQPRSI